MALKKIRLGDVIDFYKEKCGVEKLSPYDVSGINKEKEFFEPSNQVGQDTTNYQIVPKGYFACNLMHVGRDIVLPVALNIGDKTKNVSPAYTVFKLKDNSRILPRYLYMYFNSVEKDRSLWFHTDASVRDGMSNEDFCDIEIDLPDLATQQKYVDIYNAMKANQKAYERGFEEIYLSLEAEFAKHKLENHSHIYNFIEVYSKKNYNKKVPFQQLRGINENGDFVKTRDSIRENDIDKYLIIENKSFAVNFMCLGNFGKFYLGYNDFGEEYLVSPACNSFKIKTDMLNPHYFLFILRREEFQRRCVYMGDGNTRGGINIGNFLDIKIPIPTIEVQESIANIYKSYEQRKEINEQLKEKIRDICPILIKGSIDEARGN